MVTSFYRIGGQPLIFSLQGDFSKDFSKDFSSRRFPRKEISLEEDISGRRFLFNKISQEEDVRVPSRLLIPAVRRGKFTQPLLENFGVSEYIVHASIWINLPTITHKLYAQKI